MPEDRRKYPREFVQVFVEVQLRSGEEAVEANGVTVNISRGGMLALLEGGAPIGLETDCEVRFKDPNGAIRPASQPGIIVRSERRGPDREVAIDFQQPLELLATGNL